MTDQEDNLILHKIDFDDNNQERKSWACSGKPVPGHWLCFCPNFLVFCWSSLDAFEEITSQKLETNQRLHFTLTKSMNNLISTKNRVFIYLVGPSETGKLQPIYKWLKIGTIQRKFDKIYFFYQHSQPLHDVMQKKIKNLEFVQGVNFEFIDSLKNNGTKYLLIFDESCDEICNSKAFVDNATAGRHRGFSTIYIKHNQFHQSKLGIDVELQNTHIVLFNLPVT